MHRYTVSSGGKEFIVAAPSAESAIRSAVERHGARILQPVRGDPAQPESASLRLVATRVGTCGQWLCTGTLLWENIQGMRLYKQEEDGVKRYSVRCTEGHDYEADDKGNPLQQEV